MDDTEVCLKSTPIGVTIRYRIGARINVDIQPCFHKAANNQQQHVDKQQELTILLSVSASIADATVVGYDPVS